LIYLYDFLYNAIILKKGFSSHAYRDIRFEQEAYNNDHDKIYLISREKFAWKNYKLKKEDSTKA
jgi:hypothetical protein